jgi:hypothetical protein
MPSPTKEAAHIMNIIIAIIGKLNKTIAHSGETFLLKYKKKIADK